MIKLTVIFVAMIVLSSSFVQGENLPENYGIDENCHCISTFEYLPVCASNGATYSNPTMLECAKRCLKRSDLRKVGDRPC